MWVMLDQKELIKNLKAIGFDENESRIYISLLQKGATTALKLSNYTNISRTSVYRALERLQEKGLVREVILAKKIMFEASDPKIIEQLIIEEGREIQKKIKLLPDILSNLTIISNIHSNETKVKYYKGREGIRQLLWNVSKKKDCVLLGYGYQSWNEVVGWDFAEQIRQKHVENRIVHYEITNSLEEGAIWTNNSRYLEDIYHERHIDSEVLELNNDLLIGEDFVCFYSIYEGDLFGIEIQNYQIAKTQSQLFWLAWERGEDIWPIK